MFAAYNFSTIEDPLGSSSGLFSTMTDSPANLQAVAGNLCEPDATGKNANQIYSVGTWGNDQWAEITIAALTPGDINSVGPVVRGSAAGTGYLYSPLPSGDPCQIYKVAAGVYTPLGSADITVYVPGDTVRLAVVGTTLTVYHNGAVVNTTTDSTYASGYPGVHAYAASTLAHAQISLFEAGDSGNGNTYTQLQLDTFHRAAAGSPPYLGANWTDLSGDSSPTIVSDKATVSALSTHCGSFYTASVLPSDQYVEVVPYFNSDINSYAYLMARGNPTTEDYYECYIGPYDGNFGFQVRTGGTATPLASYTVGAQFVNSITIVDGYVLRMECQGSVISCYYNGVLIAQGIDTTYTSGYAGMRLYSDVQAYIQVTQFDAGSIYTGYVVSLGLSPSSVTYPTTSTGTITLSQAAPVGGIVATLMSSDTTVATVPSTVTILATDTTATFTVTSLNKTGTPLITATIGSGSYADATLDGTGASGVPNSLMMIGVGV